MSIHTVSTSALAARLSPLLLLALAACPKNSEVDTPTTRFEEAAAVCPKLAEVQRDFGASIGGTYGDATLLEYRISAAADGSVAVAAPNSSPCALDISVRIKQACQLCENQPGNCLPLITGFFAAPSTACAYCGDSVCSTGLETVEACPQDCTCGNGTCDGVGDQRETPMTCPQDCAGACGDRFCAEPIEACVCGEGAAAECVACPQDCCVATCGDGLCEARYGENEVGSVAWCENDCGGGFCGDGICQRAEDNARCPQDCSAFLECPNDSCRIAPGTNCLPCCGDGVCNNPETCSNCPEDCDITRTARPTPDARAVCFDGVCGACEVRSCTADCEEVEFECGDGVCGAGEVPANCPQDCPWSACATPTCGTCGDGICETGELAFGCPVDCASCLPSVQDARDQPVCLRDEVYCTRGHDDPADLDREAVADCSEQRPGCPLRPALTFCTGRCALTDSGPTCVECPGPSFGAGLNDLPELCGVGFAPYCIGPQRLRTCGIDPAYSEDPACAVVQEIACDGVCSNGACISAPLLLGFAPPAGLPGDEIIALGVNFGEIAGSVIFPNDLEASVLSWSPREVRFTIPEGATSGEVTLMASDGSTSAPFAIAEGPTVLAVLPPGASQGDPVRITGLLLGEQPGTVTFAPGAVAAIDAWSDREVRLTVPQSATNGPVTLTTAEGVAVTIPHFSVNTSAPVIFDVQPPAARAGEELLITGRYFPLTVQVTFGRVVGTVVSRSFDQIVVRVPEGAAEIVPLQVNGTPAPTPFVLLPTFTAVDACGDDSAIPGEPVRLVGSDLYDTSIEIYFAPGIRARLLNLDREHLLVAVPTGAESGPITARRSGYETQTPPLTVTPITDPLAPNWPIPDSETTLCAANGANTPCANVAGTEFAGQDGAVAGPAPSFVRSGSIVADSVTGLVWAPFPNDRLDRFAASCACINGTFGGQSGWRLPSTIELITLLDLGSPRFQGINIEGSSLWTLDLAPQDNQLASLVSPRGPIQERNFSANPYACVRRAETPSPSPRFTLAAETVTDEGTGLMWERRNERVTFTWSRALGHCEQLSKGGFDDWRLPSAKELLSLVDRTRYQPAFDAVAFAELNRGDFWTSSPSPTNPSSAFGVNMEVGISSDELNQNLMALVVCVRDE